MLLTEVFDGSQHPVKQPVCEGGGSQLGRTYDPDRRADGTPRTSLVEAAKNLL